VADGRRFRVETCWAVGAAKDTASEILGRQSEYEAILIESPAPGNDLVNLKSRGQRLLLVQSRHCRTSARRVPWVAGSRVL
jgi:hypothetical protein